MVLKHFAAFSKLVQSVSPIAGSTAAAARDDHDESELTDVTEMNKAFCVYLAQYQHKKLMGELTQAELIKCVTNGNTMVKNAVHAEMIRLNKLGESSAMLMALEKSIPSTSLVHKMNKLLIDCPDKPNCVLMLMVSIAGMNESNMMCVDDAAADFNADADVTSDVSFAPSLSSEFVAAGCARARAAADDQRHVGPDQRALHRQARQERPRPDDERRVLQPGGGGVGQAAPHVVAAARSRYEAGQEPRFVSDVHRDVRAEAGGQGYHELHYVAAAPRATHSQRDYDEG